MHEVAPNEVATCRSKGPKGERVRKTDDYVIACDSLRRNITQMEGVEDFESRPHKAVSFVSGLSSSCQRCCLAFGEEGCQEGAQKKQVEKSCRCLELCCSTNFWRCLPNQAPAAAAAQQVQRRVARGRKRPAT